MISSSRDATSGERRKAENRCARDIPTETRLENGSNYWLLLADPKSYRYDDLEKEKRTVWDGIAGSLAQKHMRDSRRETRR